LNGQDVCAQVSLNAWVDDGGGIFVHPATSVVFFVKGVSDNLIVLSVTTAVVFVQVPDDADLSP